jgi:hypothetical protein
MLPYTETVFASQTLSSRTTNLNPFLMISWNGILDINPKSDNWSEVRDLPVIFESKTETVDVYNYISCPVVQKPYAVSISETYGGLYGDVIGRGGESAGVAWWVSVGEAGTKANFNEAARGTGNVGMYVREDSSKTTEYIKGRLIHENTPLSPEAMAAAQYLTSTTITTTYSDGSTSSTTTAIDFKGVTKII